MNYQAVAQNFIKFYYSTFDSNIAGLMSLYVSIWQSVTYLPSLFLPLFFLFFCS